MIINHNGALTTNTHRGEPHILNSDATLLNSLEAVLQAAEVSVNVVCTERKLYAALLCLLDNIEAGNLVAGVNLQSDVVLLKNVQKYNMIILIYTYIGFLVNTRFNCIFLEGDFYEKNQKIN